MRLTAAAGAGAAPLRQGRSGDRACSKRPCKQPRGRSDGATSRWRRLYADVDRGAQAVKVLQDAQAKFPSETSIAFELGAVYDKQKKFADAEVDVQAGARARARQLRRRSTISATCWPSAASVSTSRWTCLKRALQTRAGQRFVSRQSRLGVSFKSDKLDLAEDNLRRAADQLRTNSVDSGSPRRRALQARTLRRSDRRLDARAQRRRRLGRPRRHRQEDPHREAEAAEKVTVDRLLHHPAATPGDHDSTCRRLSVGVCPGVLLLAIVWSAGCAGAAREAAQRSRRARNRCRRRADRGHRRVPRRVDAERGGWRERIDRWPPPARQPSRRRRAAGIRTHQKRLRRRASRCSSSSPLAMTRRCCCLATTACCSTVGPTPSSKRWRARGSSAQQLRETLTGCPPEAAGVNGRQCGADWRVVAVGPTDVYLRRGAAASRWQVVAALHHAAGGGAASSEWRSDAPTSTPACRARSASPTPTASDSISI